MAMSGGEAIGEAVTGAMTARAVEPSAGEEGPSHDRPAECLNCSARLVGNYCHSCGQPAHVHRSIHAWWHDFLHSVLHLEGKMWRTLPMLAWYPGDLTRRYIEGERARFVSPLAIFLFSVFLTFAVISFSGGTLVGSEGATSPAQAIAAEVTAMEERIEALGRQRAAAEARGASTAAIDAQLAEARRERDGLLRSRELANGREIRTGWSRIDYGIKKARDNPALFFYKVQNNAYKFSWALIPISVPFVGLLFLHRRRYRREFRAYDHMVFVTYSISFMSLGLLALILLNRFGFGGELIAPLVLVVPPIHIYRQLRGAYRLSRWSALWRTLVLIVMASVAVTVFFLLLLALGALA